MAHSLKVTLTLIVAVIIGSIVAWLTVFILLAIDLWRKRR